MGDDAIPINWYVRAKLTALFLQAKGFARARHENELVWSGIHRNAAYVMRGVMLRETYKETAVELIRHGVISIRSREREGRNVKRKIPTATTKR
jgi:hypothetical protein